MRSSGPAGRPIVKEAHERAVQAPARNDLCDALHRDDQSERAVIVLTEVALLDVDGEQQEVHDLDGRVSRSINRDAFAEVSYCRAHVVPGVGAITMGARIARC
jgi:hypothetical protein